MSPLTSLRQFFQPKGTTTMTKLTKFRCALAVPFCLTAFGAGYAIGWGWGVPPVLTAVIMGGGVTAYIVRDIARGCRA
jgi:hypothetical protein